MTDSTTLVLVLVTVAGLYMAWNIGANDVANAMATSVGSHAITLKTALIIAAVFEFSGSMIAGGEVTQTISEGIVDVRMFEGDAHALVVGMTCSLLAAAMWLHIATFCGWPVSTTHAIVGAVVGFGLVGYGPQAIHWREFINITTSWALSPVLGGLMAFGCFLFIKHQIMEAAKPLQVLRRLGPWMIIPIFFVLTLSMIYKGLRPLHLDLPMRQALPLAAVVAVVAALLSIPVFRILTRHAAEPGEVDELRRVEGVFMALQVITACYVAFAHGSNDVANAVGPMAAVYSALQHGVAAKVQVPTNVLAIGAVGIVLGLATYGYKVMATIGHELTELTPSRGFSAEFSAATTIIVASKLGLPVSTTHTLVGAVVGVGFARGIAAINLRVLSGIFASWFVTVPFTGLLSAGLFLLWRSVARLL